MNVLTGKVRYKIARSKKSKAGGIDGCVGLRILYMPALNWGRIFHETEGCAGFGGSRGQ